MTTNPLWPREGTCMICDQDYPTWYAPDALWNAVMRLPDGSEVIPFVCPTCFAQRAVLADAGTCFELRLGTPREP